MGREEISRRPQRRFALARSGWCAVVPALGGRDGDGRDRVGKMALVRPVRVDDLFRAETLLSGEKTGGRGP